MSTFFEKLWKSLMVTIFTFGSSRIRMMLSKHGLWKFVGGSATIMNDEDEWCITTKR
jgi:hypothetical protein